MKKTSGTSRTHGELHGVLVDTSRSKEETTCAQLLNATPSLSSKDQPQSKLELCLIDWKNLEYLQIIKFLLKVEMNKNMIRIIINFKLKLNITNMTVNFELLIRNLS